MNDFNLVGRIRPVYKGVWNAETAYTVLETVTAADNHAAYIAIKDVPAGIPLNNEEYWGVLVDIRSMYENESDSDNDAGAGVIFAEMTLVNNVYSCDMTYDAMLTQINAGKLVRLKWQTNSDVIRNYDYVGVFGMTTEPYIVFQYQSQTGYGTVFVYKNGEVKHYNGTLVRNNLTINGKPLTGNVTLDAADVDAIADEAGVVKTNHYSDMSVTSIKLADNAVWPRHVSDLVWDEVDNRINTALGVIENGTY